MADAYYTAPSEQGESKSLSTTPYSKSNPKYIQLQRVESQLNQYVIIRTYLGICFLGALVKLIMGIMNTPSTETKKFHNNIDIAIRVFQMIGYGYGLGSFNKSIYHWKIFLFYFWSSFAILAYYLYQKGTNGEWGGFVFNVGNTILNVILMVLAYKILALLKRRDELKAGLKEEQIAHDKQQNMLP